jgi:hypothetical protein
LSNCLLDNYIDFIGDDFVVGRVLEADEEGCQVDEEEGGAERWYDLAGIGYFFGRE